MMQESGPSNILDDNDNDMDNQERIQPVPLKCPFPDCDDLLPEKPR
jgi:hypothetical protein